MPWHLRRMSGSRGNIARLNPVVSLYETPSYDNIGGKGLRDPGVIVLSTSGAAPMWNTVNTNGVLGYYIDGDTTTYLGYANNGINVVNEWLQFDFITKRLITEIKFYLDGAMNCGTFQTQGYNGATWEDIGSTFVLGATAPQLIDLSTNTKGYTKYRFLGISGTSSWNNVWSEFEFKIGNLL